MNPHLAEWIKPYLVIAHQLQRLCDLIGSHLARHLIHRNQRVRIPANGRQRVPHIGADQIRTRQATSNFVIPADPGLRPGMPLHGAAQVPVKGPHIVARHPKAHGIHHTDQFLGLGIAGPRGDPKPFAGLCELSGLHQITRFFQIRIGRGGDHQKGNRKTLFHTHLRALFLLLLAAVPAWANNLPRPLSDADFIAFDPAQAGLGQLLFYDNILSGNRNINCGTCHHPRFGTSDGLSLGIGEGGVGIGPDRSPGTGSDAIRKRIPRNAPALWNLGAKELRVMFHDGRLSLSQTYGNGFDSPAQEWLPEGLNSLLAAQAILPLVAQFEMAGNTGENDIAGAAHDRIDAAWPILAKRVREFYGEDFVAAFDHISAPEQVDIADIANALAAFIAIEWESRDSAFDAFLRGYDEALDPQQKQGLDLFYGTANCASCHAGPFFSDQEFYALGLPAFGPGRTRPFDPMPRDVGLMGASDSPEDAYRFRTPMLRNVTLTAPYGHNGAYPTLEGIIRHHLDPDAALAQWRPEMANLPDVPWLAATDFIIQHDKAEMARQAKARDIIPMTLSDAEIDALVAFLHSLTGTNSVHNPPFGLP